ncbi:putative NADPH:adrenodoxin oxidoreductase, mitochondrial [Golovinomyces cichoracearum]|uniref:NADPH:adrenodoxin oxidoreductase, mitochondrial n=1 Tax=Golovinomyces cichoracearum TaxID=62708 RepID=A0A420INR6_9PEZI|nr:putative NADPH:adrenodoxin oxidoreductase, mitochondrial [Golovinomyces cichoracearum]
MDPAKPCSIGRHCVILSTRLFTGPVRRALHQRQTFATSFFRKDKNNGRSTFRLAIIGSGPSGFYTAHKVMSRIENSIVDMYERLPVPFGLVRFGVAPDHPEVKKCQEKFNEIACSSRFRFVGNVPIGIGLGSLPLHLLLPHYDAILFAYGASRDRKLGIPGEDELKGIYSAREFVGWYNGLPEFSDLVPDLTAGEEAVVLGQGNVAMDVARIILKDPKILSSTDISENSLEALRKSTIKSVRVIGRRGPVQAAFTIKEVRELAKLSSALFNPALNSFTLNDEIIKGLPRPKKRIMELLKDSAESFSVSPKSSARSVSLEFCLAPKSFNHDLTNQSRLGSMTFEKTTLVPDQLDLEARSKGTGEFINIRSSIAFVSVGYKAESLAGFGELGIPFDNQLGIIPSDIFGRVINQYDHNRIPGMYCTGWVKRGPIGVIASTMHDAFMTGDAIAEDWYNSVPFLPSNESDNSLLSWHSIKEVTEKHGCRLISWQDWQRIDQLEKVNGQKKGKEREKFRKVEDMLEALG